MLTQSLFESLICAIKIWDRYLSYSRDHALFGNVAISSSFLSQLSTEMIIKLQVINLHGPSGSNHTQATQAMLEVKYIITCNIIGEINSYPITTIPWKYL